MNGNAAFMNAENLPSNAGWRYNSLMPMNSAIASPPARAASAIADAACDVPTARLIDDARALGVCLSDDVACQFARYHAELVRWNRRANLTAIAGWEAVRTRHFLDSLSAAAILTSDTLRSGAIIDIGSGAGFPGIPLKLAYPSMRVTLVEATAKKTAFLAHICAELDLQDTTVLNGRAETLAHEPDLRERFDAVLARAVADTATLAELTLPFARIGGLVALHKKGDIRAELERAQCAIDTLGGALSEVKPVHIPGLDDDRALVVLQKTRPTPAKYPRRPGIPAKRPLIRL